MNEEQERILVEIQDELPDALPFPLNHLSKDEQIARTSEYLHQNSILHEWEHAPAFSRVTIKCRGCETDLYHCSFSANGLRQSTSANWRELSEDHKELAMKIGDSLREYLKAKGKEKWVLEQLNVRWSALENNEIGTKTEWIIPIKAQLRELIIQKFDMDELDSLCHDLGIDYEEFNRSSKRNYVLELIRYCERHDRIDDLLARLKQLRSKVDWDKYL